MQQRYADESFGSGNSWPCIALPCIAITVTVEQMILLQVIKSKVSEFVHGTVSARSLLNPLTASETSLNIFFFYINYLLTREFDNFHHRVVLLYRCCNRNALQAPRRWRWRSHCKLRRDWAGLFTLSVITQCFPFHSQVQLQVNDKCKAGEPT